jgi:ADP-ribosylglycohydrolase
VAVTETVPVCLALVKFAAGDPVRTIMLAANLGGDADTIASIAGGIAGAYAGIDAFPPEYLRRIEEVNHLDLESYAYRLTQFVVNHRS